MFDRITGGPQVAGTETATDATEAATAAIAVASLRLSYGPAEILRGIDLSLAPGRALALLGPSGSGKTTLLRAIAGLEAPSAGTIALNGRVVADATARRCLPPEKRGLGMVFQDYALWPHLSVARNVSFALEMAGVPRAEREARTLASLDRVGLGTMAARRPAQLSGGQQQRVGIARAIASGAGTVLFDEPLSNLDRELRETMVDEIAALVADLGLTALYVTHDHAEAFSLADEVAVMAAGRIVQSAPPERLVDAPASAWIAAFLRLGAVLPVRVGAEGWALDDGTPVAPPAAAPRGTTHVLFTRRALTPCATADAALTARVRRCLFKGEGYLATLDLPGGATLHLPLAQRADPGEALPLSLNISALRWFAGGPDQHADPQTGD
ncbi:ABC transporter ATP-binding protein [Acidimangrovimonas sediminis]|uniref:ABC transporter ATP-binding protein n=1 Tax=Acidimangrovimonas sediminis TaxID=2056283 RepID=UPI000C80E550|nr:ABC transporter ATP-binding protein [Acidimangrovimonas sediminis]